MSSERALIQMHSARQHFLLGRYVKRTPLLLHLALNNAILLTSPTKYQTWDLLRVMKKGFVGLCESFLTSNPGYFITPVRVNGSAIESYFSQMKYAARGQLSAANYQSAQAAIETSRAVSTKRPREADYRDAGLNIHPVQLAKKAKKSKSK